MSVRVVVLVGLWVCTGCTRELVVGLDDVDAGTTVHDAGEVDAGVEDAGVVDAGPLTCTVDSQCGVRQTCVRGTCAP